MRNLTKTIALFLIGICVSASAFGGEFVPKPYKYTGMGITYKKTINLSMTDLFEYPQEITTDANLDSIEDLIVTIEPKQADLIDLYKYEYYAHGKAQYLYLWQYENKKGQAEVDVKINYKGKETINTLIFDLKGIIATDDSFDLPLDGSSFLANIANNDQVINNSDRNWATITIDEAPTLGTAVVIAGNPDKIEYTPNTNISNYSTDYLKYTITLADGENSSAKVKFSMHYNSYASKVIDFLPAPGQFTNESIGKNGAAENTLGTKGGMISLGGFGGYVIYAFDQPIVDRPENPYGVDFSIKGNSFAANLYGAWTEPAAVQVMKDTNGNGIPDDGEWYELAGSDYYLSTTKKNVEMTYYNPHYDVRYTIPWSTNKVEKGALLTNQFHQHSYYPDPFDFGCDRDSITYTGNLIVSSLDMSTPGYVNFYRAPAFGYSDNRGNNANLTIPANPYYNDANGQAKDGFDLSWAVDRYGNHVELDTVHFVRIYTAGSANARWLGEWSSEVLGVGITTPDPDYVPQDYYLNYIGITQLKVLKGHSCQFEGFLFKNGRPINEGTPKWWVSDSNIATIDNTGKFTAISNGITSLYFQQKNGIAYDSIQVKVIELESVILEMEGNSALSSDSTSLIAGESIYITAQCKDNIGSVLNGYTSNRYTYETFDWTTTTPGIGTINNGLFKGLKSGRTMVYATSQSNPSLKDSILVVVNPVPEIAFLPNNGAEGNTIILSGAEQQSGILKNTELFTAGNKSVIYLNSAVSLGGKMQVEIVNNQLQYELTIPVRSSEIREVVRLNISSYGINQDVDVEFVFRNDITGIDEQQSVSYVYAYPNPFVDYLLIGTDVEDVAYIYNATGLCVIESRLSIGENRISTANLPKGIYVLKTKTSTIKLFK